MDLERDFAAWADRRDPEALARVFDGTAGRLLLLAAHVAGSGGSAEDLVQSTFLAAMTGARSWDPRSPLWPWLAGILQNEARMHWRRQQRRREEGLGAVADATSGHPDPARLVASEESFAAVLRAIDALPLPYRQVLRLRLVHGLQPVEIARALEVPVGTVSAQIHRGLAQLREALPAGVAVLVGALLAGEGALLSQVRAHVLGEAVATHAAIASHAAVATSPIAVLLTAGWWTLNAKTIGLVAAAVALLLGFFFAIGMPAMFERSEPLPDPLQPMLVDSSEGRSSSVALAVARTERPPDELPASPAWPLVVTVRTDSGQRVADALVQVSVVASGSDVQDQLADGALHEEVGAGKTAADGTFRCALDAFRTRPVLFRRMHYVAITAVHPRRGTEWQTVWLPRTTEAQALAVELVFGTTCGITGRVVDGSGAPVVGAHLYRQWDVDRCELMTERSGADGSFCIAARADEDVPLGGSIVAVHPRRGVGKAPLPEAPAPPLRPDANFDAGTIVLDDHDAIRGQVVLGDGSGLGSTEVFVLALDEEIAEDASAVRRAVIDSEASRQRDPFRWRQGRLEQVRSSTQTDADGSFACSGLVPGVPYAVFVRDVFFRHFTAVARPGSIPVRITVDRQLLLIDVRGEDGEPLRGANVEAMAFDPDRKPKAPPEFDRPGFPEGAYVGTARFYPIDAQGRRMLLSPFGWVWRISCFDESAQGDFIRHDSFAGVHRAEGLLVLHPAAQFGALHLSVVDESGAPFPHYGFQLHCLDRDIERNLQSIIPPADGMYRDIPSGRWRLTVGLGKALPGPSHFPKPRGEQEQEIVIEHGRTTEVTVVTQPLGRVAFRLRADVKLHELQELRILENAGGAEFPCETYYVASFFTPFASGTNDMPFPLLLGKPGLAPGRHGFLIAAKGYLPVPCEAEVKSDEVVEVDVVLTRQ